MASLLTSPVAHAAPGDDPSSGEDTAHQGQTLIPAPAGVSATRKIPSLNLSGVAAPHVIRRSEWGADESIRVARRAFAPLRKLVVHHTASANRPSDPAAVVRQIYTYHVQQRGFADIGYNFLIDHRGNIYEGRYSRRFGDEPISGEDHDGRGVVGAHAKGMNGGTCGICLIGNFDLAAPTDAALSSLQWLLAWKASRQRIDASVADPFVNVIGSWATFGNIAGHRNVGETACPGKQLYGLLPTLRQNVVGQAGHWDSVIADVPGMLRYEWTTAGQGPLAGGFGGGSSGGTGSTNGGSGTSGGSSGDTSGGGTGGTGGTTGTGTTATTISAYRAITSAGQVFTVGTATKLGQPGKAAGKVVAMAHPGWGDGYATLSVTGGVTAYGRLSSFGDLLTAPPSGGSPAAAVDLALTPSGAGYWILLADGGIYPFGDARHRGSTKKLGLTAAAVRMAARPQGDGYWVLLADGTVRGFGAASSLGGPGTASGLPVGLAPTASGAGYWVLLDTGEIAAFGDAPAKGGLASKKTTWAKPAAAIARVGSAGYLISARDGGLFTFNGAPYLGSFAGSGATVVGVVPAASA